MQGTEMLHKATVNLQVHP